MKIIIGIVLIAMPVLSFAFQIKQQGREVEEPGTICPVEIYPEPVGGMVKFYKYINSNLRRPSTKESIEGKVFVEFTVNTDGSLTDVHVIRGLHPDFDKEAVRLIKGSPAWTPGKQGGKFVKHRMIIPISFKLT